jgi:hypothetical protein
MSSSQGRRGGDASQRQAPPTSSREGLNQRVAAGTKALMVEDDHNSRFALTVLLERVGLTVLRQPTARPRCRRSSTVPASTSS